MRVEDRNTTDMAAQFTRIATTSKRAQRHPGRGSWKVFLKYYIPGSAVWSYSRISTQNLPPCSPSKICGSLPRNVKRFQLSIFALWLRKFSSLGIEYYKISMSRSPRLKQEPWIDKRPTSDHRCSDWQRTQSDDWVLTDALWLATKTITTHSVWLPKLPDVRSTRTGIDKGYGRTYLHRK